MNAGWIILIVIGVLILIGLFIWLIWYLYSTMTSTPSSCQPSSSLEVRSMNNGVSILLPTIQRSGVANSSFQLLDGNHTIYNGVIASNQNTIDIPYSIEGGLAPGRTYQVQITLISSSNAQCHYNTTFTVPLN